MGDTPQGARRVARAAARRLRLGRAVLHAGRALAVGSLVGLGLVALERLALLDVRRWLLLAAPLGAGALWAVGAALSWRITPAGAAARVDEALGLRDRLRSAIELAGAGGQDPAFVAMSVSEAERVAPAASVREAIPVRWGWAWGAWPLVVTLAATLAFAAPRRSVDVPAGDQGARASLAERERAAESVEETARLVREIAGDDAAFGEASREELERLEELERELTDGAREPEEAIAESADALERLADEMESDAERAAMEREAFEELMDGLEPASDDQTLQRLSEAMKGGDMEAARNAAGELLDRAREMNDRERQRLAQDLESLASQLDELAARDENNSETPGAPEPPAGDTGAAASPRPESEAPEPAQRPDASGPAPTAGPEQTAPANEPRRPDPIREQSERRDEARDRARRDARDIAESLRETADETRRRSPESQEPGADAQRQGAKENQGAGERTGEPEPRESDPRSSEGTPERRRDEAPQDQRREGGDERVPSPSQRPTQGDQPRPEQGDRGDVQGEPEQGEPAQGEPAQGEQGGAERQRRPADDGSDPQGAEESPAARPSEQTQGDPGRQPSQRQGGQRAPGDTGRPGPEHAPGGVPQSIDERLERMAERQREGEHRGEAADRLRDRAQEMLGRGPSEPQEQRGPAPGEGDGARQVAQGDDAPRETELMDARPDAPEAGEAREQVIADWYSDDRLEQDPAARREAAERLRDAARSAERAVEQQRVPRKYRDLVRRVNSRRLERAGDPADEPAPLGRDADDAGGSP